MDVPVSVLEVKTTIASGRVSHASTSASLSGLVVHHSPRPEANARHALTRRNRRRLVRNLRRIALQREIEIEVLMQHVVPAKLAFAALIARARATAPGI